MNSQNNAWTSPSFEMLKMDAEIGSYQEDSDFERDAPAFVREAEEG